jgi:hypothetical protein
MQTVLRCHIAAFEAIDSIPHETPISACNMPPWRIARPDFSTDSSARWADAAILMTTMAESFMKAMKVGAVDPMAYETSKTPSRIFHASSTKIYNKCRLHSALGYLSPQQFEDNTPGRGANQPLDPVRPQGAPSHVARALLCATLR